MTLTLDGRTIDLVPSPQAGLAVWTNVDPIELLAGALSPIAVTVENVRDTVRVQWESVGHGREVIPSAYLYAATLTDHLRTVCVRAVKAASFAATLKLAPREIAHIAAAAQYAIGGEGWLNRLPVSGSPDAATSIALVQSCVRSWTSRGSRRRSRPMMIGCCG